MTFKVFKSKNVLVFARAVACESAAQLRRDGDPMHSGRIGNVPTIA